MTMTASSDKSTCTTCGAIKFLVTSVTNDEDQLARLREADFVVVTKLANANFDHFAGVLDGALDGLLSRVADGWTAEFGTYRLLCLRSLRVEFGKLRYVLLFGLGGAQSFKGKKLCAFAGFTMSTAARCEATTITYMESPHKSTENSISLAGTAAIMNCRAQLQKASGQLRKLDTIEYLARPQAKNHLLAGLQVAAPRCVSCSDPKVF
jgi:hypothetical protein